MKIFDCFLYYDEDLILDIRLNQLNEFIEKFVIIESKFDHQGNLKKLNFQIDKFQKFKDKIVYLVIEGFPNLKTSWERENFQRDYIINGISQANDDDYIMISDIDEIPNFSAIKNLTNNKFSVFKQKMFYYKINLLNKTEPIWFGSKICKKKYLKSPQWLRNQKIKKHTFWKFYKIKWNIIENGGWHFSFLMTPEHIRKKLKSYAHSEFNKSIYTDINKIEYSIEKKIDIFNRDLKFEKIEFDQSFPNYILKNKDKFKQWIIF